MREREDTNKGVREENSENLGQLTEAQEQLVVRLHSTMEAYFPECGIGGAREVAVDAFRQADLMFGASAAAAWAADYEIPKALVERDIGRFAHADRSLVEMARVVQRQRKAARLNPMRVQATLSVDNPEYATMMEFVTTGVPLLLADDFRPSGIDGRPRLRSIVQASGWATTQMLLDSYVLKDLAIVLPLDVARTAVEEVNLSADSWATKQAAEEGRTVVDANDGGTGSGLNSQQVYDEAIRRWQKIANPTLDDITLIFLSFFYAIKARHPSVQWSDLRLWKMDLKGTFTLLDFAPEGVPFLGTEVPGG